MADCIAVLNAGSSSVKFALYDAGSVQSLLFRGQVEGIGVSPHLHVTDPKGRNILEQSWPPEGFDHRSATRVILEYSRALIGDATVRGVGHRIVHGGTEFAAPVRIDAAVRTALAKLCPLAPLHQPHNLAPIEAIADAAPHVAQVACFDTAFHRSQPSIAQLFGLPRKFTDEGVRRYGFHGLSYEFVADRLKQLAPSLANGRIIIAHLGNGASLCGLNEGRSVATTMGFTALDGLVMGTRCGSLDPGVLLYLMNEHKMRARDIEDLLYRKSGLAGVSGLSSDMRTLRASSEPGAAEAIALFAYRIVREIGSLAAALGGLDGIVFTGGIGEHDSVLRSEVSAGCRWLGAELDEASNVDGRGMVSTRESGIAIWVVPTDEERMIARHTMALLEASGDPRPVAHSEAGADVTGL